MHMCFHYLLPHYRSPFVCTHRHIAAQQGGDPVPQVWADHMRKKPSANASVPRFAGRTVRVTMDNFTEARARQAGKLTFFTFSTFFVSFIFLGSAA